MECRSVHHKGKKDGATTFVATAFDRTPFHLPEFGSMTIGSTTFNLITLYVVFFRFGNICCDIFCSNKVVLGKFVLTALELSP